MSEKVSLLQSIPPVETTASGDGQISLLSRTKARESESGGPNKQNMTPSESAQSASGDSDKSEATEATETAASISVAEEAQSISVFQYVTYISFVLNFVLAGFAAVILFKKASKILDERFSVSMRSLAAGAAFVVLHGFFVTYLYASYLNDPSRTSPLVMTLSLWIILGPLVGYMTRNLLARREKPNRSAAIFDGCFYAFIFALATFGISPAVSTNGALLLTITACFLMIVPLARSLTAYKVACARHRELKETSSKILVYGLLLIPALLPLLAFVHIFGLGDLLTLFLINFITIDFILVATISFLISSDYFAVTEVDVEADVEQAAVDESGAEVEPSPAPAADSAPAPTPSAPQPAPSAQSGGQKIVTGNPDDPIIQYLNSEGDEAEETHSPKEQKPKAAPRIQPPRKPGHPGLSAPKKPSGDGKKSPSNAPSKVKAPSKPKKRL